MNKTCPLPPVFVALFSYSLYCVRVNMIYGSFLKLNFIINATLSFSLIGHHTVETACE